MSKLIRLYNQNRALVIAIIACIALILIIIQTLNSIVKEQNEEKAREIQNGVNSSINNETAISPSNTSTITGEEVRNNKTNKEVIKQFVESCNEGDIEYAYSMLSDECKDILYPSLERFKTGYYNRVFYINRMYTLENWYTTSRLDTYHIKYTEDVLATGNTKSNTNYNDYITVERKNGRSYINISNYVGCEEINKSKTVNGITITLHKLYMYVDDATLDMTVTNNNLDTICIDTREDIDTSYLYDLNKIHYSAFLNENTDTELIVKSKAESQLKVKFDKRYNPDSRDVAGFVLKDIVLNYDKYKNRRSTKRKNIY